MCSRKFGAVKTQHMFCALLLPPLVVGTIFKGQTGGMQGQGGGSEFNFLGKFCFDGSGSLSDGTLASGGFVRGWVSTPQFDVSLAIYDDQRNFWAYVHHNASIGCAQKLDGEHAKKVIAVTPVELDHSIPVAFQFRVPASDRPRFWYVVLAKCGSLPVGVYARYMLETTQADGSQVPVNERGLRELYGLSSVLWLGLVLTQAVAAAKMLRAGVFHPLAKLLAASVVMYFGRNLALFGHWGALARNGQGVPGLEVLAHVSSAFVRVFMLLLLMLIAKGWTISTTQIPQRGKLIVGVMVLLLLYTSLALWDLFYRDPASSMYIYDSAPGISIAATHIGFLCWFSATIYATLQLEHSPVRRKFFVAVWRIYAFYLLILPCAVLVATFVKPWMRQKVVEYVLELCNTCAYAGLIYFLWPSRAPTYFQKLYVKGAATEGGDYEARQSLQGMAANAFDSPAAAGGSASYDSSYQDYDDVGSLDTGHAQFDEL